jgi:hypothetical protein
MTESKTADPEVFFDDGVSDALASRCFGEQFRALVPLHTRNTVQAVFSVI